MNRVWFAAELETVATFWRVIRRDGVTLGFTSHDGDQWFDGVLHRAAPGMVPSAIRRSADFEPDSAEVEGALGHHSITAADLAAGRFDGARVRIGVVDWETGESWVLYRGSIGAVSEEDGRFSADLQSRKAELLRDPVPRTSPSCRAEFCGPGCALPSVRHTHETTLAEILPGANEVRLSTNRAAGDFFGGRIRFVDGHHAGMIAQVIAVRANRLVLDIPVDAGMMVSQRVIAREGCDRTLATCSARFANAINFQGEPFLPGNDLITRYPTPQ